MGTPHYMPPEQARGRWEDVDGRSDVWAVGATMFELLSGRMVHDGHTANEVLLEAMTKPAPRIVEVAPKVTPAVARLVDKALAFEREKRWLDAGRMQEALRHAYVDRYGAQISTAPKLTVPETVPNRTLANARAEALEPRQPTTAQPVARSKPDAAHEAPKAPLPRAWIKQLVPRGGRRAALAAGGLALGVLGTGLVSLSIFGAPAASATSSGGPAPMVTAPAASSGPAAMPPSAPPAIAATDLPRAEANNAAAPETPPAQTARAAPLPSPSQATRLPPTPAPVPAPQQPATPAKSDCSPPYTVDSTGHRHWKAQCL